MSATAPGAAPAAPAAKKRRAALDPKYADNRGVWVLVEHERGQVHPVSWELMGQGRKLADALDVELTAILIAPPGEVTQGFCREAFAYGADRCRLVADPLLADYRNQPYTHALTELVRSHKPEILLLGATTQGRDLAGSVATTLETGLTADCTRLEVDLEGRTLLSSRPTFGGSLMCTIVNHKTRPQMATVRPRVMPMPEHREGREGPVEVSALGLTEDQIATKLVEFIPDQDRNQPQLAFADFIVAGGRGLGSADNFAQLTALARTIGAEVGASRAAVHAGWAEPERQVGQSGKTVRPKLYIAAGISGAVQHRVGMEGSDLVLAINTDPQAPIFQIANYGLVGNALELLPALERAFQKKLAQLRAARQAAATESPAKTGEGDSTHA